MFERKHMADKLKQSAADLVDPVLPDEEMLYDLADLFKVFGDTTRLKLPKRLVCHKVPFRTSCAA